MLKHVELLLTVYYSTVRQLSSGVVRLHSVNAVCTP